MHERRKIRFGLKVIHRHRIAGRVSRRVSELVFIQGQPKAIFGWIDVGGVRTPMYLCDLDPAKLRRATGKAAPHTYYYDDITVDPRFEELAPASAACGPGPTLA